MRKYSENMFNKMMEGAKNCRIGNHSMEKIGENYYFRFHGNTIFVINCTDKVVLVDNCGYFTTSTTQAINSHLEAFCRFAFWNEFEFVDLSQNKHFARKIKNLFDKNAMSESEFVESCR